MSTVNIFQVALELWGGLFCLIAAFIMAIDTNNTLPAENELVHMLFSNCGLLVSDSMAYVFRGRIYSFAVGMTIISNFAVYVLQFMLLSFAVKYLTAILAESDVTLSPRLQRLIDFFSRFGITLVCVNVFIPFIYTFDATNHYYRLPGIALTMGLALVCLLIIAFMCILYGAPLGSRAYGLICLVIFPLLGTVAQSFLYGLSLMNIGITAALVIIYVQHQKKRALRFREQTLLMAQQKEELTSQRIELMTSQIQPHFIFNSLATISCLCSIDPELAEEATNRFAQYLRVNLDTLGSSKWVSFKQEMDHTRTYLWLEKLRFDDALNIVYHVDDDIDFILPPLTVQPIVENAVKHGICKKRGGGTITISVQQEEGGHRIVVEDDGVGFDASVPPSDGRTHVGLTNTRERLHRICNGEITINSKVGEGTRVEIFIPQ